MPVLLPDEGTFDAVGKLDQGLRQGTRQGVCHQDFA